MDEIFISYVTENREFVQRISEKLDLIYKLTHHVLQKIEYFRNVVYVSSNPTLLDSGAKKNNSNHLRLTMFSKYIHIAAVIACTLMIGCVTPSMDKPDVKGVESVNQSKFSAPEKVTVENLPVWHGRTTMSLEEPFVSRDGQFLFFNSNEHENNKDLHYARLINDKWVYRGEVGPGINRLKQVDANPSMDDKYNFYYIASETKSFIKKGKFNPATEQVTGIEEITGFPEIEPHLLKFKISTNMGVEVSSDGNTAYFSRATFRMIGLKVTGIMTSDILFSEKIGGQFVYHESYAKRIMTNINTSDLEYAASISNDGLILFFTRLSAKDLDSNNIRSAILYATRTSRSNPFGLPKIIRSIGTSNFVEGPSISGDGKELYYHKREGKKFGLYKVRILEPLWDESGYSYNENSTTKILTGQD